jgi:hypothetical protein
VPFVPTSFEPPSGLVAAAFVLEPLGPRHNEADYAAWSSSIAHIQATPGFEGWSWPHEMTLAENLADLEMHERHFGERSGFTYTVLDPDDGDVIGCLYIYPLRPGDGEGAAAPSAGTASVRSWVRADRAELDELLWQTVSAWLEADWPFERVVYAPRG